MGLINVDAGQRSHSESFFGTHANVYGDELPNPQLTVLPDSSAHNLNLPTPPFGLDSSVSVQKKLTMNWPNLWPMCTPTADCGGRCRQTHRSASGWAVSTSRGERLQCGPG